MSYMVNEADLTGVAASVNDVTNQPDRSRSELVDAAGVMKRLKTSLIRGNPHEDVLPNRRGKDHTQVPVKLHISGRNLKNMDIFSKSDPLCVILEKA